MTEEELSRTALEAIEKGDFSRAREIYGHLLEDHPESQEYACGLYTAGYWNNRIESFDAGRPGRILGGELLSRWDDFQSIADERDYPGYLPFRAAMHYVLGFAADGYRRAFQEEGGGSVDLDMMVELGQTLIRIGNHRDALDILLYARKVAKPDARIFFLTGESMACVSEEEIDSASLSSFRDGFFVDPGAFDPSVISSEPVSSVFLELFEKFEEDMNKTMLWMPSYLHARSMLPGMRRLLNSELEQLSWESERLERDVNNEKFGEKVRSRLAFYYMAILYHYTFHDEAPENRRFIKERVKSIAPELFEYMKKHHVE